MAHHGGALGVGDAGEGQIDPAGVARAVKVVGGRVDLAGRQPPLHELAQLQAEAVLAVLAMLNARWRAGSGVTPLAPGKGPCQTPTPRYRVPSSAPTNKVATW